MHLYIYIYTPEEQSRTDESGYFCVLSEVIARIYSVGSLFESCAHLPVFRSCCVHISCVPIILVCHGYVCVHTYTHTCRQIRLISLSLLYVCPHALHGLLTNLHFAFEDRGGCSLILQIFFVILKSAQKRPHMFDDHDMLVKWAAVARILLAICVSV